MAVPKTAVESGIDLDLRVADPRSLHEPVLVVADRYSAADVHLSALDAGDPGERRQRARDVVAEAPGSRHGG